MQQVVIIPEQEWTSFKQQQQQLVQELQLLRFCQQQCGWVSHMEAQRILEVASVRTLHSMAERKEIEVRQISPKKFEVSLLSIACYLQKKGFTSEHIKMRVA
ncbi:hypothetical protein [Pontibacter rugosus]|uniref:Helix-turn-helix domain-containing protein n=1 Tax=Pontibacter rugosus TaxID=1745966 RepID=A0ABW3SKB8_9BACT